MKFSSKTLLSMVAVANMAASRPFCDAYTVRYSYTTTASISRRATTAAPSPSTSSLSSSSPFSAPPRSASTSTTTMMMSAEDAPNPTSFREAEVLGLRLMQEGNFEEALVAFQKGMKLPGSRPDVLRTKALSGPSPVGGAFGGTESQSVNALDDFELQAAHYNMACAHARLGNLEESIGNLAKAFENGFDNYSTVRGDPDLDPIKQQADFQKLMDAYETKGFNPFGFFGKK